MKKVIQTVKISIFMGILILPSLLWQGIKLFVPHSYEELNFDLGENRTREELPDSFAIKGFTVRLEAYYNDNVPFRSSLVSLEQRLSGALEGVYEEHLQDKLALLVFGGSDDTVMDISNLTQKKEEHRDEGTKNIISGEHHYECQQEIPATCLEAGSKIYVCQDCGETYVETIPAAGHDSQVIDVQEASYTAYGHTEYQCAVCKEIYYDDFVGKLVDNSYLAPKLVGQGVVLGRFDWLFYSGDDSISYYTGSNILSQEEMEEYLGKMKRLQELCDELGIQLQFMIMPNKEQIYPEYMPSYEIENEYKRADRFVDYVREHSDVNIIYPIQELKEAELYWQTYYQYDTHWNCLGGYVGVCALYDALGMPAISPHDLDITLQASEVNGLFALGGLNEASYPPGVDYQVNYKPEVTVTDIAGGKVDDIYLAGSDSENKKKFVFLGDSFRSFMADYLVKDFSDSVIAHRNSMDDLEDDIRNADILVISAVERYDSQMFPVVEKVVKLLEEGD